MTLVVETSLLIEKCRCELVRLSELAREFKAANEISQAFLTGAFKLTTPHRDELASPADAWTLKPDPREWRERAERTRVFAELVSEPRARRLLLEIAESYDSLAQ